MAKSKSGEGKIGLILALTFFVLTSIGLGVYAYNENSKVEDAVKKEKAAAETQKKAEADLLAERKRLYLYMAFAGAELSAEQKGVLTGLPATDPLRDEHQKLMARVASQLKSVSDSENQKFVKEFPGSKFEFKADEFIRWNWPATGSLPESPQTATLPPRSTSLVQEMVRVVAAAERFRLQSAESIKAAEAAAAANVAAANDYAKAKADLEAARNEAVKAKDDVVKTVDKAKADAAKAFTDESDKHRQQLGAAVTARNQAEQEKTATQEQLKTAQERIEAQAKKDEAKKAVLPFDLPKGKIVSRRGNVVEINLGTADKLQNGVTFTVQPLDYQDKGEQSRIRQVFDPRGRPVRDREGNAVKMFQPKGTIEVIEVLGPNLAKAQITGEYDETRERIMEEDLLYNASWTRGNSDHIVLVGIFDKDGNGTDDIKQVAAELKKAGVIVDGYWDLATGKWAEGGPTERTAYAIRGEFPILLPGVAGEGLVKEKENLRSSLVTALTQADKLGAKIISYRDYFPRVGYKVATGVPDDAINQASAKYLQAAPPPPAPDNK